ncbi:unnamed protein product [Moneuplotes crassus]|uniref:Uncharacterized protein n=1 Tax=Euplotes crassus TaxID=5936 RepID=A0AAD1U7X6_EUPCR|nr:unnamed protein product [Moneuplotes crassus]
MPYSKFKSNIENTILRDKDKIPLAKQKGLTNTAPKNKRYNNTMMEERSIPASHFESKNKAILERLGSCSSYEGKGKVNKSVERNAESTPTNKTKIEDIRAMLRVKFGAGSGIQQSPGILAYPKAKENDNFEEIKLTKDTNRRKQRAGFVIKSTDKLKKKLDGNIYNYEDFSSVLSKSYIEQYTKTYNEDYEIYCPYFREEISPIHKKQNRKGSQKDFKYINKSKIISNNLSGSNKEAAELLRIYSDHPKHPHERNSDSILPQIDCTRKLNRFSEKSSNKDTYYCTGDTINEVPENKIEKASSLLKSSQEGLLEGQNRRYMKGTRNDNPYYRNNSNGTMETLQSSSNFMYIQSLHDKSEKKPVVYFNENTDARKRSGSIILSEQSVKNDRLSDISASSPQKLRLSESNCAQQIKGSHRNNLSITAKGLNV